LRLGIAGPGLIGGSIALRARSLGAVTIGWEPDLETLRDALERGVLSDTSPSLLELASACDMLVLSAPLDATLEHLAELAGAPRRAGLVIDVASVKAPIAQAAAALRGFVATHPIAGSERSGNAAARADLFEGKVWAYDSEAAPRDAERVCAFVEQMGARPYAVRVEEHDRIVALTSHLPQLLSVMLGVRLAERLEEPAVVALSGTGVTSMLRLAKSSWDVWEPILVANAHAVSQEVRELAAILLDAAGALESGSPTRLKADFSAAARAAARLEANGLPMSRVDAPGAPPDRE
jgi:prephenate dehydrogenase